MRTFSDLNYPSPDLKARAEQTAWMNNFLYVFIFNLTDAGSAQYGLNVTVGDPYPLRSRCLV